MTEQTTEIKSKNGDIVEILDKCQFENRKNARWNYMCRTDDNTEKYRWYTTSQIIKCVPKMKEEFDDRYENLRYFKDPLYNVSSISTHQVVDNQLIYLLVDKDGNEVVWLEYLLTRYLFQEEHDNYEKSRVGYVHYPYPIDFYPKSVVRTYNIRRDYQFIVVGENTSQRAMITKKLLMSYYPKLFHDWNKKQTESNNSSREGSLFDPDFEDQPTKVLNEMIHDDHKYSTLECFEITDPGKYAIQKCVVSNKRRIVKLEKLYEESPRELAEFLFENYKLLQK